MNLKEMYKKEVVPALMKEFNYSSVMEVPKLEKIMINMGVSDVKDNSKALIAAQNDLMAITGQNPIVTKAKKSIPSLNLKAAIDFFALVTIGF